MVLLGRLHVARQVRGISVWREVIQEMVWRILVHPNPQKVRFVKHKSSQEIFKRINEKLGQRTKGKEHLWFQAVNTQS